MKLSEFDYKLPKELIAQQPSRTRGDDRLLVLDRARNSFEEKSFSDIIDYFREGDLLVLNDTKVIPARLFGRRKTGGKIELFLLEKKNPVCEALTKPSGRLKEGERITLESGDEAEIMARGEVGRFVRFSRPLDDILREAGHMPLPPYISRPDEEADKLDYQTVYAKNDGATASPTAGLHLTESIIDKLKEKGVKIAYVTLHVSYGTFAPVKTDEVEKHKMHKEYFELPAETADAISRTKKKGGRVFAVGTTTTRVLEHCAPLSLRGCRRQPKQSQEIASLTSFARNDNGFNGYTDMFIYPGYKFSMVDGLITNFHLPKSTLILLTSAFAGKKLLFKAYDYAIWNKFRFFSYGDAMLIL